jgi:hypothetical protein
MKRLITFLSLISMLASIAHASINFSSTTLELTPKPTERNLNASFAFTNTGESMVTILDIKTSCGCTVAELDKKIYAPGEGGEIKVTYKTKGISDSQTITVLMDDKEKPQEQLKLIVMIKELLSITPKQVMWDVGEEAVAKDIKIRVIYKDEPVKVVGVVGGKDFKAEMEEVGGEYILHVTPSSTAQIAVGKIDIKTDYPAENPMEFRAFARVK